MTDKYRAQVSERMMRARFEYNRSGYYWILLSVPTFLDLALNAIGKIIEAEPTAQTYIFAPSNALSKPPPRLIIQKFAPYVYSVQWGEGYARGADESAMIDSVVEVFARSLNLEDGTDKPADANRLRILSP